MELSKAGPSNARRAKEEDIDDVSSRPPNAGIDVKEEAILPLDPKEVKEEDTLDVKTEHTIAIPGARKAVKKEPKLIRVKAGHPLNDIRQLKYEPQLVRGITQKKQQILSDVHIVMTPINVLNPTTEHSVMGKNDYMVEEAKFYAGDSWPCWDDVGRGTKAQVGDYFAFCHNQRACGRDLAEVFRIEEKRSFRERPKNWLIKEHKNRQVLVLSRYIGYTSVTNIMVAVGSRPSRDYGKNCLRGTQRRLVKKDLALWLE